MYLIVIMTKLFYKGLHIDVRSHVVSCVFVYVCFVLVFLGFVNNYGGGGLYLFLYLPMAGMR